MLIELNKNYNKDENVHRFALSAIRGELLERKWKREKEKEREKKRERDSSGILYTGYLLSIVKIKIKRARQRERNRERERMIERERERQRGRQRETEQQIINKIDIDSNLFVKWNKQIKLGRFRQKQHEKASLSFISVSYIR